MHYTFQLGPPETMSRNRVLVSEIWGEEGSEYGQRVSCYVGELHEQLWISKKKKHPPRQVTPTS